MWRRSPQRLSFSLCVRPALRGRHPQNPFTRRERFSWTYSQSKSINTTKWIAFLILSLKESPSWGLLTSQFSVCLFFSSKHVKNIFGDLFSQALQQKLRKHIFMTWMSCIKTNRGLQYHITWRLVGIGHVTRTVSHVGCDASFLQGQNLFDFIFLYFQWLTYYFYTVTRFVVMFRYVFCSLVSFGQTVIMFSVWYCTYPSECVQDTHRVLLVFYSQKDVWHSDVHENTF